MEENNFEKKKSVHLATGTNKGVAVRQRAAVTSGNNPDDRFTLILNTYQPLRDLTLCNGMFNFVLMYGTHLQSAIDILEYLHIPNSRPHFKLEHTVSVSTSYTHFQAVGCRGVLE